MGISVAEQVLLVAWLRHAVGIGHGGVVGGGSEVGVASPGKRIVRALRNRLVESHSLCASCKRDVGREKKYLSFDCLHPDINVLSIQSMLPCGT